MIICCVEYECLNAVKSFYYSEHISNIPISIDIILMKLQRNYIAIKMSIKLHSTMKPPNSFISLKNMDQTML